MTKKPEKLFKKVSTKLCNRDKSIIVIDFLRKYSLLKTIQLWIHANHLVNRDVYERAKKKYVWWESKRGEQTR